MKSLFRTIARLLILAQFWQPIALRAEDIDIFTGGSIAASNPSILFVLDNTSNWARQNQKWPGGATQGQAEANAIKTLLTDSTVINSGINLGLMEFVTEGNANNTGGFIRYPISVMSSANKAAFSTKLTTIFNNINAVTEKRNSNTEYGWLESDVYNYLTGGNARDGLNPPNPDAAVDGYTSGNFATFRSPITQSNGCGRIFQVFISNPNASGPADDSAANKTALQALGCDVTNVNLPNFTSTTVGAGTSDLGYQQSCTSAAAAVTSDYTSCSDGTYDSCAVDTSRFTSVASCAAGTQRYMVTKTTTTAAATTTLGTTSDCVASCSTADYATCSDGTYPGGCSCPSSVATCPTGKQRYTVTETTTGGTTSLLGVTSKCKTSAAAWAGEAYVDFPTCIAADNVCSQTAFPTTSGSCPSGTARYMMQDVTTSTSSVGPTDACYSSAPAASATSLATTCSAAGASCATPVTTGAAGSCAAGTQRYMVQNSLLNGSTSTVGPTAACYSSAPASVPSDMTTACASGTCASPAATATSGSCPAGQQRYMVTESVDTADFVLTPVTAQALACSGKNGSGPATVVTTVSSPPAGTSYSGYKWLNTNAQGSCANNGLSEWKPVATRTVVADKGYSATCGANSGAVSTAGYTSTGTLLVDGTRSSAGTVACPGTYKAYNYTLTAPLRTNKGYTLACYATAGAAATTGYAANVGAGNSLVISTTDTSTSSLSCSGGNITGSYNAYNYTKTGSVAVNKGYTLACYASAPTALQGSTGYTFANTATVSSTTSAGTLACPSGYYATQITNTATANVNTTLGTTNTCTTSAPTSFPDFPTSCTGAGISCSAGTPTTSNCPTGERTYTVQGSGVASSATTDLGYTNSCYASAAAASTADYSAQCAGAGVSCQIDSTRSTTTSMSNCAANTYRYMVTGSTLGTVTSVPTGTYSTTSNMLMADEWARCLYQKDLSPDGASATAEQFTADFSTSGAIVGADTISFDGATTTLAGGESSTDIATKVASTTYTNWSATSSGPIVTFVNFSTGPVTPITSGNFTIVDAGSTGTMPAVAVTTIVTGANATGGALGRQNVTTYTIDVYNAQQNAMNTALMMSMAQQGGGRYFSAKSEAEILTALKQIISEIQSVNTAFAAASIPLSTTNRSQNLNEVYIGVFRPSLEPRWFGNLKKFKIATTSTGLDLVDSLGVTALNSQTGFLNDCAVSFWTSDSGVWWDQVKIGALNLSSNALLNPVPKSSCVAMPAANTSPWSDLPDGQSVEKGAVAGIIRRGNNPPSTTSSPTWQVNRTIYTRSGSSLTPLTAALAGGDTDLYNYIRGVDIDVDGKHRTEKTLSSAIANVVRPSVHGDVVHSRPLAVNYGVDDTVVYYGSNDGMMRAVDGLTGKEKWAFIPIEFLDVAKQTRLMADTPYIAFGASPATGSVAKDYMFDGSAGIYQSINNTKVWLYPAQRRGGRMLHALNVTNNSTPSLMWYKGCPNLSNDTGCSTGFEDMGQTWSIPVVTKIKGYVDGSGVPKPVVVFGGGYDTCEDARPSSSPPTWACSTAKGRAVFVVDAEDGTLLRKFTATGMRGVTAGISFTDINNDGYSDYAYVADLGGTIFRISFIDNPTARNALTKDNWSIKKVAYTSGARKFMFSPAVTFAGGTSVYVALGSGDRERPLESDYPYQMNVKNYAYAYRDILDAYDAATTTCNLDGDPAAVGACVLDYTTAPSTCDSPDILPTGGKQAWRVGFSYQGEQTVTQAIILGGMVSLNTTRPVSAGVCSAALGEGGGYFLNLLNGSGAIGVEGNCGGSVRGKFTGVGLPTDPVVVNLPGQDPLCIGCVSKTNDNPNLGSKLFQPTPVRPPISKIKSKKYRYTVVD